MTGNKPNCNSKTWYRDPRSNRTYIDSPGYDGSQSYGLKTYPPEGEVTEGIVTTFADDHNEWQNLSLEPQKDQLCEYDKEYMTVSP